MNRIIYFLVDKPSKQVTYSGPLPEVWESITGLTESNYTDARELSWAGQQYAGKGFMTYADALEQGVSSVLLEEMTQTAYLFEWTRLGPERDERIQAVRWRVDRYNDYIAQGLIPPEPVEPLLTYIQAIRDLRDVYPNPFVMVWPTVPALPA